MRILIATILLLTSGPSLGQVPTAAELERSCIRQAVKRVPPAGRETLVTISKQNRTVIPSSQPGSITYDFDGVIRVQRGSVAFSFSYRCLAQQEGDWQSMNLVAFEKLD